MSQSNATRHIYLITGLIFCICICNYASWFFSNTVEPTQSVGLRLRPHVPRRINHIIIINHHHHSSIYHHHQFIIIIIITIIIIVLIITIIIIIIINITYSYIIQSCTTSAALQIRIPPVCIPCRIPDWATKIKLFYQESWEFWFIFEPRKDIVYKSDEEYWAKASTLIRMARRPKGGGGDASGPTMRSLWMNIIHAWMMKWMNERMNEWICTAF